ncbi:MAG: sigma-70 family RNA polymerase sigma factor [Saprospiraceae bacterium]|nr:sigma-70 family RNA polymerase sigma factor [Saprospiraceae bacterium]
MSTIEFAANFQAEETLLLSFAYRLTNDQEDAKDLMQETAYKAFRYRTRYQPHTNLRAWLMTIMRNTFINDYRHRKRRRGVQAPAPENYPIENAGMTDNQGVSNLTVAELEREINALEDWLRVPFYMHCQGYKYEDIAEALSIPLGTVKSRIFFARKQLQAAVKELYASRNLEEALCV